MCSVRVVAVDTTRWWRHRHGTLSDTQVQLVAQQLRAAHGEEKQGLPGNRVRVAGHARMLAAPRRRASSTMLAAMPPVSPPQPEQLATPLAWLDDDGRIAGCNPAFARWLGAMDAQAGLVDAGGRWHRTGGLACGRRCLG